MRFPPISSLPSFLQGPIARGATGTFILRVINIGIVFGTTVVLTRTLGPSGYGAYSFTTTWLAILVIPATLGLDTFLVREVAAAQSRKDWSKFRGYMRSGHALTALASVVIVAVCFILLRYSLIPIDPTIATVLTVGLFAIPCLALARIRSALLRGLGKVVVAQLPDMIVLPFCVLLLIGGTYVLFPEALTSHQAALLYLVATVVALLIGWAILYRITPQPARHVPAAKFSSPEILKAVPFFWLSFASLINQHIDITLLGILADAQSVGLYQPAARIATLVAMPHAMLAMAFAPRIASLYADNKISELGTLATKTARTSLLLGAPLVLFVIIFASWILSLFGNEYTQADNVLIILCVSKLLISVAGFAGLLLSMTKHATVALLGLSVSMLVNIISNVLLIPTMGIIGAAIGTAASVAVWSVIFAFLVWKKLGIDCTVLGLKGCTISTGS